MLTVWVMQPVQQCNEGVRHACVAYGRGQSLEVLIEALMTLGPKVAMITQQWCWLQAASTQ
jgi:hypothetical protein